MIPAITKRGSSFKGAFLYYFHDKKSLSTERVAWTRAHNLASDCPDTAWKLMAYTANSSEDLKRASGQSMRGARLQKPVLAFSLSWHPEQTPSRDHMEEVGMKSLQALGLDEHEVMMVCHTDEPHPHIHIIANAVHPYTGKVNTLRNSKERLQVFASDYERETQIYCKQREANRAEKEKGKRTRYCDPVIQQAWEQSDSGKAFVAVLAAQGYFLARGRKRIVVVTPHQKTLNLRRHLPQTASAVFKQRMADLSDDEMPPVDDLSSLDLNRQIAEETVRKVNLREKHKAEMERLRTSYKSEARAEETRLQHKIDYHIRIIKRLRHKMDKATFWHRLFGRKKAWARQLSTRKAVIARVQKQTRERTSALITIYRHKVEQMRLRHQEELGTPLSRYLMPPGGESPGAPAPSAD